MAQLKLAAGLAVLKPVEDVGVADVAVDLELIADAADLIAGRIHGAGVENGFQDPNLFGFRIPARFWLRRLLLCSRGVGVRLLTAVGEMGGMVDVMVKVIVSCGGTGGVGLEQARPMPV